MTEQYESVELVGDNTVQYFAMAVVVAALTAALAQFTVPYPFSPAPFTLQTVGVYLAGLLLGPLWGALSLLLYAMVGAAGAPVFAGFGAGFGVITGPTGGYILSFPIAAGIIGALVHRRVDPRALDSVSVPIQVVGMLVGLAVIYAIGSVWLAASTDQSLVTGLIEGGVVFVPGDLLKAVAVISLVTGGHLARISFVE
ncbi:biotin transport system substrate-specific component [Halovenus aranensis]|jgi:biotin transport system substrate-specific component|uniref:Biotin transport system substrate-specific component n=1 Tax=Halovenus aranensis TaxID=890420 RepID=A0A1G8RQS7_9EURY|nr:biotin transporter BioY [Halovenus aranensis]SDJ19263.1 biotin transport system substrate-specific component [Halovenus aranensis]